MNSGKNIFNQICNTAILRSGVMNDKDYESLLERLIMTLIEFKKYDEFTKEDIFNDFFNFYSLRITRMMIGEIVPDLIKKKIVVVKKGEKNTFVVNKATLANFSNLKDYEYFVNQKQELLNYFVDYALKNKIIISNENAEDILAKFIVNNVSNLGITANVIENDEHQFIVYCFINYIKENRPTYYEIYKNILVGRMLATFVLDNSEIIKKGSAFDDINIFLDSGFIFNLLGLNAYSSSSEYSDLLATLRGLGAHLFVFDHVFTEVSTIIDSASQWIDNPVYLPSKSSKATEFFLSNKYSREEIEEFLFTLKTKLNEYGISIFEVNIDYNEPDSLYEADIKQMIMDEYKTSGYLDETKNKTYDIDAKSIYTIHKLRRGRKAHTIHDAKYIFVTTNRGLARTANKYNLSNYGSGNVAYAITDTFLSVLLFFTYSNYSTEISEKFFVPMAYHAFEPSKELIKKMEIILDEMKEKGTISESDATSWKTNLALRRFVVLTTNNNAEKFDEMTPEIIMKLIQKEADEKVEKANKEATEIVDKIYADAESKINALNKEKDLAVERANKFIQQRISLLYGQEASLDRKNKQFAKAISIIIIVTIVITILGLSTGAYYLQMFIEPLEFKIPLRIIISFLIALILLVPSFINIKAIFYFFHNKLLKTMNNSKKHLAQKSKIENEIKSLKSEMK